MSSSGSDESKGQKITVTVKPGREYLPSTPVGGSDELRDELERVFQAMNPEHTQLSDFVDAARPVVVRRVADAWDEGYQAFGDYLEGPEFDVLPRNPYRAASIETGERK